MQKFLNVVIAASLLFVFLFVSFSVVRDEIEKEKIEAAYEQLDAKGGIARFPELAVVDLDTSGGNFSRQDLAYANRTKKHILKDPVTGDLYVGVRTCVLGLGVFKVDEEGKILQKLTKEEFYKLGVVDRLVK